MQNFLLRTSKSWWSLQSSDTASRTILEPEEFECVDDSTSVSWETSMRGLGGMLMAMAVAGLGSGVGCGTGLARDFL